MKYSQEELNQILLSKPLSDFYLAVIENRKELLTDKEYEEITRRNDTVYTETPKEELDKISENFKTNEKLKRFAPDLMRILYSLSRIRYIAILTIIDYVVYNIGKFEFLDLKRNKIIHYDNLTNYYNETNARIRFFTPEEDPQLEQITLALDVDDESIIHTYESEHVNQEESEDLTNNFFDEAKCKSYTLSNKKKNQN